MANPNKIPTAIRKQEDKRVHRRINNYEPSPNCFSCVQPAPAHLSQDQVKIWDHYFKLLHGLSPELITELDMIIFEQLVCQIDILNKLNEDIRQNGYSQKSNGREYARPQVAQRLEALREVKSLGARFALSPSDRAGMEVHGQAKEIADDDIDLTYRKPA